MSELGEIGGSMQEQLPVVGVAPPPPPATHHRRPRVREVSSRFMSPVVSSSSSGDLHLLVAKSPKQSLESHSRQQQRSSSVQRQRHLEMEPLSCAGENRLIETNRSLETPCALGTQRKYPRTGGKVLKENGSKGDNHHQPQGGKFTGRNGSILVSRPDTPTVLTSRSRVMQRSTPTTAAAKLLQLSEMSSSDQPSSPQARLLPEMRSSMLEADMLRTVSNRFMAERNGNKGNMSGSDSLKVAASPCSRSLNVPFSKMGGLCMPPVPPSAKPVMDARKGRKVSSHQEDVHTLRMLHNRYLQWRFANAKADASMHAQKQEAERILYSHGVKVSNLYESVMRKRIELGCLRRTEALSTILESQMPHLEEWSAFKEDYSTSLSEAIQSLLNTSLRLPISGNVRADIKEVGEAVNSAIKMMESIAFHVQRFMPKAEETEILISELARVTGGEKALVEECGDILAKTYASQVEECSLRGQLIQLHQYHPYQPCQQ